MSKTTKAIIFGAIALVVVAIIVTVVCVVALSPYIKIKKLLDKDYANVKVTTTVTRGDDQLVSFFDVASSDDKVTINYSVQEFAKLSLSSPQDGVVTRTGTIVVQDGKIVLQDGEAVDISFDKISKPGMNFKRSNFANVKTAKGAFAADIVNLQSFLGSEVLAHGTATVKVLYQSDALQSIVVDYTTASSVAVHIVYNFN